MIICLMGPTASGKTALSLELARYFPIEIINVDATLVYKGLDIGSGKPSLSERKICPHHLIDIRAPNESYSAAQFRQDALQLIPEILARGKIPVLVGGTMLYFKALQEGLSDIPIVSQEIRIEVERQAEKKGWEHLYSQLLILDPLAASRIKPQDKQRIQRALEVFHATGRPLSDFWQQKEASPDYNMLNIALVCQKVSRACLHKRIALRFDAMLADGLVEEVKALSFFYQLNPDLPALRSVGYRQVWEYLKGEVDFDTMKTKALTATRQLAKRQLTWLRQWGNQYAYDYLDRNLVFKVSQLMLSFPRRAKSKHIIF